MKEAGFPASFVFGCETSIGEAVSRVVPAGIYRLPREDEPPRAGVDFGADCDGPRDDGFP
jgi:hypothetical protein